MIFDNNNNNRKPQKMTAEHAVKQICHKISVTSIFVSKVNNHTVVSLRFSHLIQAAGSLLSKAFVSLLFSSYLEM